MRTASEKAGALRRRHPRHRLRRPLAPTSRPGVAHGERVAAGAPCARGTPRPFPPIAYRPGVVPAPAAPAETARGGARRRRRGRRLTPPPRRRRRARAPRASCGPLPCVVASTRRGSRRPRRGSPTAGVAASPSLVVRGRLRGPLLRAPASRRTPTGRLALKVLFAAHVLFWTATRARRTGPRARRAPVSAPSVTPLAGSAAGLPRGRGEASFRLDDGRHDRRLRREPAPRRVPLAGRRGRSRSRRSPAWRDPSDGRRRASRCFARGTPGPTDARRAGGRDPSRGGGAPLAICRLDLVMCDGRVREAVIAARARPRLHARHLGRLRDAHAQRARRLRAAAASRRRSRPTTSAPTSFERVVAAAARAIRAGARVRRPRAHRLRARARRGARTGAAPRDEPQRRRSGLRSTREVLGVRLDAADDGRRIALLLNVRGPPRLGAPDGHRRSAPTSRASLERAPRRSPTAAVVVRQRRGGRRAPAAPSTRTTAAARLRGRRTVALRAARDVVDARASRRPPSRATSARHARPALLGSARALARDEAARRPFGEGLAGSRRLPRAPRERVSWSAVVHDVKVARRSTAASASSSRLERCDRPPRASPSARSASRPTDGVALVAVVPSSSNTVGRARGEGRRPPAGRESGRDLRARERLRRLRGVEARVRRRLLREPHDALRRGHGRGGARGRGRRVRRVGAVEAGPGRWRLCRIRRLRTSQARTEGAARERASGAPGPRKPRRRVLHKLSPAGARRIRGPRPRRIAPRRSRRGGRQLSDGSARAGRSLCVAGPFASRMPMRTSRRRSTSGSARIR